MGKLADPGGAETFQRGEEEESVFQLSSGSAWERLLEAEQALNQTPAADSDVTARHAGLFPISRRAFSVHCRSFIICSRKALPWRSSTVSSSRAGYIMSTFTVDLSVTERRCERGRGLSFEWHVFSKLSQHSRVPFLFKPKVVVTCLIRTIAVKRVSCHKAPDPSNLGHGAALDRISLFCHQSRVEVPDPGSVSPSLFWI